MLHNNMANKFWGLYNKAAAKVPVSRMSCVETFDHVAVITSLMQAQPTDLTT